jgi:hypothetical protein
MLSNIKNRNMSLNHLMTIEQGLSDRLNIGAQSLEVSGNATFDGSVILNGSITEADAVTAGFLTATNRLEANKSNITSQFNFFETSSPTVYSTTGNYTLTPAQVVNGLVCINTQPSNLLLPTGVAIAQYIQQNVTYTILDGFSFNFTVSVVGNSLGCQIDTTDDGRFFGTSLNTVTVGTLATTRPTNVTKFTARYNGVSQTFDYY